MTKSISTKDQLINLEAFVGFVAMVKNLHWKAFITPELVTIMSSKYRHFTLESDSQTTIIQKLE